MIGHSQFLLDYLLVKDKSSSEYQIIHFSCIIAERILVVCKNCLTLLGPGGPFQTPLKKTFCFNDPYGRIKLATEDLQPSRES